MRKNILLTVLIIAIFAITISFVWANERYSLTYLDLSRKALHATDAKIYELNVQGWGQLNHRYLSEDELKIEAEKILASLQLPIEYNIDQKAEGFINMTSYHKIDVDTNIVISLQTISQDYMPDDSTYVGILISSTNEEQAGLWFNKIKHSFTKLHVTPELNVTIVGVMEGQLEQTAKEEIIEKAFIATESNVVEGVLNPDLVSISAYSKLAKESLTVGQNKININIALRYHELDDKTYVYVGAPLIQMDY